MRKFISQLGEALHHILTSWRWAIFLMLFWTATVTELDPIRPYLIGFVCVAWAYSRWIEPHPWLGGISSYPTEPSAPWRKVFATWVKGWTVAAILLFVVALLLPPRPEDNRLLLGLVGLGALTLTHIAILRDCVFEWRLTISVVSLFFVLGRSHSNPYLFLIVLVGIAALPVLLLKLGLSGFLKPHPLSEPLAPKPSRARL